MQTGSTSAAVTCCNLEGRVVKSRVPGPRTEVKSTFRNEPASHHMQATNTDNDGGSTSQYELTWSCLP